MAPTPAPPRPGPGPHTARAGPPPPRALDPIVPDVGKPPLRPARRTRPGRGRVPTRCRGRDGPMARPGPVRNRGHPARTVLVTSSDLGPRVLAPEPAARQPPAEPPGPRARPADEDAGDDLRPAAFAPADRPRAALTPGPPAMAPGPATAEPRAAGPRSRPVAAGLEAATGPAGRHRGSAARFVARRVADPVGAAGGRTSTATAGRRRVGRRRADRFPGSAHHAASGGAGRGEPAAGAPATPARPAPQPLPAAALSRGFRSFGLVQG